MRYIIIYRQRQAFYTNWFNPGENWCPDILCVIDYYDDRLTFDGKTWINITYDHL